MEGSRTPSWRTGLQTHGCALHRAESGTCPLAGDLGSSEPRSCAEHRRCRGAARLRALPPDARWSASVVHSTASAWSASCAGRCAARRPAAPRSCTRPSTSAPCAAPRAARVSICFAPPWTPSPPRHDRPAARGGLRLPRGHRQPPGVHRPLPQGLAADAGRVRRAAAPGARFGSTRRCNRFGWGDMTFVEVEPPYRIVARRARRASSTASRRSTSWTLEPRPGGGTRVEFMTETEPALPTDRSWRPSAAAAAGSSAGRARRCERLQSILEEDQDRGARATVGGLLDSAARCAAARPRAPAPSLAARARRLRQQGGDRTSRRDRGHLPRRRRPRVPGPDLALLNPADIEDREYLDGPAAGTTPPPADEIWFGVFMRVENTTDEPLAARRRVRDQRHRRRTMYRPVQLDPTTNPFAYQPSRRCRRARSSRSTTRPPARARSRARCCCSSSRSTRSQNRPLELQIVSTGGGRRRTSTSTSTSSAAAPPRAPARRGRGRVAARALADEQHRDRDARVGPRGRSATNQASVSVVSSSGGGGSGRVLGRPGPR